MGAIGANQFFLTTVDEHILSLKMGVVVIASAGPSSYLNRIEAESFVRLAVLPRYQPPFCSASTPTIYDAVSPPLPTAFAYYIRREMKRCEAINTICTLAPAARRRKRQRNTASYSASLLHVRSYFLLLHLDRRQSETDLPKFHFLFSLRAVVVLS